MKEDEDEDEFPYYIVRFKRIIYACVIASLCESFHTT